MHEQDIFSSVYLYRILTNYLIKNNNFIFVKKNPTKNFKFSNNFQNFKILRYFIVVFTNKFYEAMKRRKINIIFFEKRANKFVQKGQFVFLCQRSDLFVVFLNIQ